MGLQAVGLMVSEKIVVIFPHFKSIEAYDSMASIDTRSMDGRIYVGDHKTYIYKLWVSPFQRRRFFKVFPVIRLYMPEFQSNQPKTTCILSPSIPDDALYVI